MAFVLLTLITLTTLHAQDSGLQGWYVATSTRQQFNMMSHNYDYIVRRLYYNFFPDGRVCQDLPQTQSMEAFDYAAERALVPAHCGSYGIAGGKIEFRWANGATFALAFNPMSGGALKIAADTYRPIAPAAKDMRLEGSFRASNYIATAGVSSQHSITFTSGGTFVQEGFIGLTAATAAVNAATSTRNSGRGAYRISGYTLELIYADGARKQCLFFRYPGEESDAIVIDKALYTHRK